MLTFLGMTSLGYFDAERLVELKKRLDLCLKSGDAEGVNSVIRICKRIETTKEHIKQSHLGKILFQVAKDWRQSDQGELKEASKFVRTLIDDWKVKYYGKSDQ